jgi:RNA polymerase sigma-70 factor (ECF subfamily)
MEQRSGFFSVVDDLVIQRAKRGDGEAFEKVYSAFSDAVFTLARRLCASTEEAEDVLQETFLEVSRSLGRYRGRGALGAWVRRITVSKAIDARRRRRRKRRWLAEAGGSTPNPTDRTAADSVRVEWQRVDLERALDRLPREARMVVWLHDVEGFTHAEIAEVFERTVSFSKSQLARARVRLREELHGHGGFEDVSEEQGEVGVGRP